VTPQETARLAQSFALYAAYYRVKLDDEVLKMYAEDLSDLELMEVQEAMRLYRKNPKNRHMPLPAQIREMLEPQLDDDALARDAASRIVAAVSKFGWCNSSDAKAYIGELGWRVVDRHGGWLYVCENLGRSLDVGMFQAQARELAKTQIQFSRAGNLDTPPALPGPLVAVDKLPEPSRREFLLKQAQNIAQDLRLSPDPQAQKQLDEILKAVKTIDSTDIPF
jgi:hypothetical protein